MVITALKVAVQVSRPPFLLLPLAVLFPLFVYVSLQTGYWDIALMGQILLVALAASIAVNALNEYQDFTSGLDLQASRTPFSGGSGVLPQHPQYKAVALGVAIVALFVTTLAGLNLVAEKERALLYLGVTGVVLIVAYTRWINRLPLLCLAAPGIGFGLLMINGAGFVLLRIFDTGVFALSLVVTCLASSLLLLNQFPDIAADRKAGRWHYPIARGVQRSAFVFMLLLVGAYFVLMASAAAGLLPPSALTGLLTIPLAVKVIEQVLKSAATEQGGGINIDQAFVAAMGKNIALTLLTPLLAGLGMLLMGNYLG